MKTKKLITLLLATVMFVSLFAFSACAKDETYTYTATPAATGEKNGLHTGYISNAITRTDDNHCDFQMIDTLQLLKDKTYVLTKSLESTGENASLHQTKVAYVFYGTYEKKGNVASLSEATRATASVNWGLKYSDYFGNENGEFTSEEDEALLLYLTTPYLNQSICENIPFQVSLNKDGTFTFID